MFRPDCTCECVCDLEYCEPCHNPLHLCDEPEGISEPYDCLIEDRMTGLV